MSHVDFQMLHVDFMKYPRYVMLIIVFLLSLGSVIPVDVKVRARHVEFRHCYWDLDILNTK